MERIFFGDNQFFGINHFSEEKARQQAMKFQDISAIVDVLQSAHNAGVTDSCAPPMTRSTESPGSSCPSGAVGGLPLLSRHALRPQIRERRHRARLLGGAEEVHPQRRHGRHADPRQQAVLGKDIESVMAMLVDAEMKMFEGLETPIIFLQNVVTDLILGLGYLRRLREFRRICAAALQGRAGVLHDEPAEAGPGAALGGIENPIVCANVNKVGFRMSRRDRGLS